ncbi:glycoside hydrolase family 3 C-terminal domain-containing protein [Geodermatophilus sp. DSM 45219]|uniref:glycoside hydrolase family 3 C-terminal domain-containing protein n=1 Tax=Geodermatophilus sp. DSM 45219 TaxID=1881103 RepID=UPI00088F4E79|nr:glycoside hydrolase family 3 C-terminal domain-containing protein [Geodermatophilus sp. DSM 45219]SDO33171.1 beta-glucosidase [Geodermatophilus sp. DSM 45219]
MTAPPGPGRDTVASLTTAEKAALCLGSDFWHTAAVDRLGIERIRLSDGPHGLRVQPAEGDHVGISGSLPATCFPTASALGASWDVDLIGEVGAAIGLEARAQDVAVVLGPGVNIKRSPLCGRNFEYLSEDPHLSGRLGAALVAGIQSQDVGASVKHFAANNQETDRLRVSADVDERTLREIYLPAFEHVVTTARPWTVMCAYNRVNGVHASQDRWLLTEVLREQWGFDGLVVSDWGAVHDRVAALAAGLDLEMPPDLGVSDAAIVDAVASGALDETVLDTAVARVLRLVERSRARRPADIDVDAHHALARRAAARSIVLLKNDDEVLPLTAGRVCVVGAFARTPRYQGAGSSQVHPTRVDTALDELRRARPDLTFAAGFDLTDPGRDAALADEAVAVARDADVVVAFLGLPSGDESEGFDRTSMDLPASQTALLDRLLDGSAPVVVVLANGSAVLVTPWHERAAAVVECWLGGQAAGGAIADVLTGAVNPSGRLSETLPLRLQDVPSHLNFPGEEGHVRYGEGVFVGYRGFDAADLPVAYPFGHGLSYTRFHHADLSVATTGSHDTGDLAITARLTVTNTGAVAGREVVQLYVGAPPGRVARPPRELRGFTTVDLEPGDSADVELILGSRDLAYWSTAHARWVVEPGPFTFEVGASSRDIRLRATVHVDATPPRTPLDGTSTLQEWLADPDGAAAIRAAAGTGDDGRPTGVLGDPELLEVIGNFPLTTLAAFPGLGITHELVRSLTGRSS